MESLVLVVMAQEVPQAQSQEMASDGGRLRRFLTTSWILWWQPIALYPDAMLAQTLAASTYPLEVMQLNQWMDKNKNLKDKALADAVAKRPWDPSVQSMAAFPDVVKPDGGGNMSVDDRRGKCGFGAARRCDGRRATYARKGAGHRESPAPVRNRKWRLKTTQSGQQVIVVERANPEAAYVPSYDPEIVYGAAPAEYPYYPYSYPGYQPGRALAWGSAIAVGGVWANNNWGNCDWDDGNVTINNSRQFQ